MLLWNKHRTGRPTQEEAEEAVRTLLRWAGDDPNREGLIETPNRVVRSYSEFFSGYDMDPAEVLMKTFEEAGGYDEMVLVRDIELESHCEHHMVPIIGRAHVAYIPNNRVVGISKLARVVEIFASVCKFRKNDRRHRNDDRQGTKAARRRRRDRGKPPVHDDTRRAQARRGHGDQPDAGRFPR